MKPIWIIEGSHRSKGGWYSCWYEVFYTKKEGLEKLRLLKNGKRGFSDGSKYRVVKYVRLEK